jgi:hypothetical protein
MYGIAISCCGLMPCGLAMTLSVVTGGGGGDGVDTPPAEATERSLLQRPMRRKLLSEWLFLPKTWLLQIEPNATVESTGRPIGTASARREFAN